MHRSYEMNSAEFYIIGQQSDARRLKTSNNSPKWPDYKTEL